MIKKISQGKIIKYETYIAIVPKKKKSAFPHRYLILFQENKGLLIYHLIYCFKIILLQPPNYRKDQGMPAT